MARAADPPPGAQNSSLYVKGLQINHQLDGWGVVAAWTGGITLTANYVNRQYSVDGPLSLADGATGVLHLVGSTDNYPPVALAGPDVTATVNPRTQRATINLHGQFFDPDSDNVAYEVGWLKVDGSGLWSELAWNTLNPSLSLTRGVYTIVLFVWDQNRATSMDYLIARVQ